MDEQVYGVVIEPIADEEGGGFLAAVPELAGCMSDGETRQEGIGERRGCHPDLDLGGAFDATTPVPLLIHH